MSNRCVCGAEIHGLDIVCDDCLTYVSKRLGAEGDIYDFERQHGFDVYRFVWRHTDAIRFERTYNHWL